jgi:hypothetical protein
MVDDPVQNPLVHIMAHLGLSLHEHARHGMVAIVSQRDCRVLEADANYVAGQRQHAQLVLHGGAEFRILQLQSWHHGQGPKPCGRCLTGAAAEASKGLLVGNGDLSHGFQKLVEAVLRRVQAEYVLCPCNDGHVGHICGALVCLPESVCWVVQGLPLLAEPSAHRPLNG